MPPIPNRVADLRQAGRLTARDVANRLNTTERTVYRWEHGEVGIPDRQKIALADLFGVSVQWLMCWEGNGEPTESAA